MILAMESGPASKAGHECLIEKASLEARSNSAFVELGGMAVAMVADEQHWASFRQVGMRRRQAGKHDVVVATNDGEAERVTHDLRRLQLAIAMAFKKGPTLEGLILKKMRWLALSLSMTPVCPTMKQCNWTLAHPNVKRFRRRSECCSSFVCLRP